MLICDKDLLKINASCSGDGSFTGFFSAYNISYDNSPGGFADCRLACPQDLQATAIMSNNSNRNFSAFT
jgi:hypothetical protein